MNEELEEACIECLDMLYSRRFCDDELWKVYQMMLVLMHKLSPKDWADPSGEGFSDPWIHGERDSTTLNCRPFREGKTLGNVKRYSENDTLPRCPPPPPPPKKR